MLNWLLSYMKATFYAPGTQYNVQLPVMRIFWWISILHAFWNSYLLVGIQLKTIEIERWMSWCEQKQFQEFQKILHLVEAFVSILWSALNLESKFRTKFHSSKCFYFLHEIRFLEKISGFVTNYIMAAVKMIWIDFHTLNIWENCEFHFVRLYFPNLR